MKLQASTDCYPERPAGRQGEGMRERPVEKTNAAAVEALREFCSALIEELANLGGEERLFTHMKGAVETAAGQSDLSSLEETWNDLKIWTRGLTPQQQAQVARQMRQKLGMTETRDDADGTPDLLIPDPPIRLESDSS